MTESWNIIGYLLEESNESSYSVISAIMTDYNLEVDAKIKYLKAICDIEDEN